MIRFARSEDAEALLEIYRPYVEATSISFETAVPSVEEFRRRILTFSEKYPYLVLEEGGQPLGYAYAHAFHSRAAYDWAAETTIYLRQDLHRRGYGRKLYTALLRLMEAQGLYRACAVVVVPNEKSMGLHRALGFDVSGVLPEYGYKMGQWRSVTYLTKRLRPTDTAPEPFQPVSLLPQQIITEILG
ncbi:MAG: GNAT family N-acetyltransferase [Oscillospiraceae bacterium]|nr:GNAT family N-acetyltransferase [Oscillospiraceae bacterium]